MQTFTLINGDEHRTPDAGESLIEITGEHDTGLIYVIHTLTDSEVVEHVHRDDLALRILHIHRRGGLATIVNPDHPALTGWHPPTLIDPITIPAAHLDAVRLHLRRHADGSAGYTLALTELDRLISHAENYGKQDQD